MLRPFKFRQVNLNTCYLNVSLNSVFAGNAFIDILEDKEHTHNHESSKRTKMNCAFCILQTWWNSLDARGSTQAMENPLNDVILEWSSEF